MIRIIGVVKADDKAEYVGVSVKQKGGGLKITHKSSQASTCRQKLFTGARLNVFSVVSVRTVEETGAVLMRTGSSVEQQNKQSKKW